MGVRHWIGRLGLVVLHFAVMVVVVLAVVIASRPSETGGSQPNFAGVELKQKRLVLFLDGTWNSTDSNTNVWRMRALCAAQGKDVSGELKEAEAEIGKVREEEQDLHEAEASAKAS